MTADALLMVGGVAVAVDEVVVGCRGGSAEPPSGWLARFRVAAVRRRPGGLLGGGVG